MSNDIPRKHGKCGQSVSLTANTAARLADTLPTYALEHHPLTGSSTAAQDGSQTRIKIHRTLGSDHALHQATHHPHLVPHLRRHSQRHATHRLTCKTPQAYDIVIEFKNFNLFLDAQAGLCHSEQSTNNVRYERHRRASYPPATGGPRNIVEIPP